MNKRKIGTSDLCVTEISLGTNAVGGHNLYESLNDADGIALVNKAYDLGINFYQSPRKENKRCLHCHKRGNTMGRKSQLLHRQ